MRKFYRLFLSTLLTYLLLLGGTVEATGLTTPISVRFDNYYLDDAVVFVADGAGMSWLTCGEFSGTISLTCDNLQSSQALDQITTQNDLTWQANQGIIVVRSNAKTGIEARINYGLTKIPLLSILQVIADTAELRLVVRGKLSGEVTESFNGTMKEAVNLLAVKYGFKWSSDSKVIKVSPLR